MLESLGECDENEFACFWGRWINVFTDEKIVLRRPMNDDKDSFLMVQRENAFVPFMLEEDSFCDSLWEEHLAPSAIMCSIVSTETNEYIGYCGIKDTSKVEWEIAIEILDITYFRNKSADPRSVICEMIFAIHPIARRAAEQILQKWNLFR